MCFHGDVDDDVVTHVREVVPHQTLGVFPLCRTGLRWSVPDGDWPEGVSEPSVEMEAGAGFPPCLKRGQGSRNLGVDMTFDPDEVDHRNEYFTSSGEIGVSVKLHQRGRRKIRVLMRLRLCPLIGR